LRSDRTDTQKPTVFQISCAVRIDSIFITIK
jgi:hypothetical protein